MTPLEKALALGQAGVWLVCLIQHLRINALERNKQTKIKWYPHK